ncbi:MAG: TAXI family TRAP transporter solute-binding subunit [Oscillospiraceae bacterium]
MKKLLSLLLATLLIIGVSACSNGSDTSSSVPETTSVSPESSSPTSADNGFDGKWDISSVTITTGPSGGTHEIVGAAAAEIWKNNIPGINFSSIPSSGTSANIPLLNSGEAQVGVCTGDSAVSAINGVSPYDQKYTNVKGLFALYPNTLQIWVQADSDIQDFGDLIDKKFTFAAPGSGPFQPTLNMMALYGFSEDDVKAAGGTIEYLDWGTAVSKLQDGLLDAVIWTTSYPAAKIVEAETTRDLRLLQVDTNMLDKFMDTYGGWISVTIPAGTYKNQPEDVITIGTPNFLCVLDDMDNDLAYALAKALWENRDILGNTHALLKSLSLDNVAKGMGVELHPGALKYYKEIGAALD